MSAIAELLDLAKKAKGIESDNAFAVAVGWRRQIVSQWRNGDSYPSEENIAFLAVSAHQDVATWLVKIKAERSEGAAGKAWAALAKRLGAAAAIVLYLAGAAPSPAVAQVVDSSANSVPMYIMSTVRRWLRGRFSFARSFTSLPA